MTGYTQNALKAATLIAALLVCPQMAMAGKLHIRNGGPVHCEYWNPPGNDGPIIMGWFHNSAGDMTITDLTRPFHVLGGSGPWNVSLSNTDPLGNVYPNLGILFELAAGGTPADANAVFIHALEAGSDTTGSVGTDLWLNATSGWTMETFTPIEYTDPLPGGLTLPDDYQFLWDNYLASAIPEPSAALLCAAGLLSVIACRRRM